MASSEDPTPASTEPVVDMGPPVTADADVLEAAVYGQGAFTPLGTRAQALRCQGALGDAAEHFAPTWYAYDDQANPDTPIRGCELGESDSILEALPWGEGRTELCAIGWRSTVRKGSTFPYVGMGVRTAGSLTGVRAIVVETRSTGTSVQVAVQLNMQQQEALQCGDDGKAPREARIRCDGSGEWRSHRLPLDGFQSRWGKPPPLDLEQVSSLHFQNVPGHLGPLECDIRIAAVEKSPSGTPVRNR